MLPQIAAPDIRDVTGPLLIVPVCPISTAFILVVMPPLFIPVVMVKTQPPVNLPKAAHQFIIPPLITVPTPIVPPVVLKNPSTQPVTLPPAIPVAALALPHIPVPDLTIVPD